MNKDEYKNAKFSGKWLCRNRPSAGLGCVDTPHIPPSTSYPIFSPSLKQLSSPLDKRVPTWSMHAATSDASAGAGVGTVVGSTRSAGTRCRPWTVAGRVDRQRVVVVVRRVVEVQLEEAEYRLHRTARAHSAHLRAVARPHPVRLRSPYHNWDKMF